MGFHRDEKITINVSGIRARFGGRFQLEGTIERGGKAAVTK